MNKQMKISLIVAVAEHNVIGKDNSLIWKLPADMKYFKEKTTGHCVITGRKSYDSIPEKFRPLPNRTNIVITTQKNYEAPGALVVNSLQEAIDFAKNTGDKEVFIIGGAEIYKQFLPMADRIYITNIYHEFEGDCHFPEINLLKWNETVVAEGIVDEKNIYPHDFILLERI